MVAHAGCHSQGSISGHVMGACFLQLWRWQICIFPASFMHAHSACPDAVLAPACHLFNMLPCPELGKMSVGQICAHPSLNLQEPYFLTRACRTCAPQLGWSQAFSVSDRDGWRFPDKKDAASVSLSMHCEPETQVNVQGQKQLFGVSDTELVTGMCPAQPQ